MANARLQSLSEQRSQYRNPLGGNSRRVLAPASTGISSIAKQNAANESDIMITRYNAGQIGNAEMKSFFEKQLKSPYVTQSDKSEIQTKMVDFDQLIEKDRLESVFKQAPENSLAKMNAATALADFYNARASSMVAGTPAHSQALENAGVWQQNVKTIQDSVNKQQRTNYQNIKLQDINQLPTSSSSKSSARAQMYKGLYDMAVSQGDTEDAQKYAALAEQENTYAQQFQEQEAQKSEAQTMKERKKLLTDTINSTLDDYHDGKLNEPEVLGIFAQIDPEISSFGDTSLMLSFNRNIDTIQKNLEKGGLNRAKTSSGLTAVVGKGKGGQDITGYDKASYDNVAQMREIQKQYRAGEIDALGFQESMAYLIKDKNELIEKTMTEYETIASENPNAKAVFNGQKTRVASILDSLNKEYEDIASQVSAIRNGTFGLVETPASALGEGGKSVADIKIINTENLDPKLYAQDDSGLYHPIQKRTKFLTELGLSEAEMQAAISSGGFVDPATKQWTQVAIDKAGNPIYYDLKDQYVKISNPEGKVYEQPIGKNIPSYQKIEADMKKQSEVAKEAEKVKQIELQKQTKNAVQSPLPENLKIDPIGATLKKNDTLLPGLTKVQPQVIPQTPLAQVGKTVDAVKKAVEPVVETVKQVINPVKTTAPVQTPASSMPGLVSNQQVPKFTAAPSTPQTTVNVAQAVKSGGLVTTPTPAPVVKPATVSAGMANTITVNNKKKVKQYDVKTGKFIYV